LESCEWEKSNEEFVYRNFSDAAGHRHRGFSGGQERLCGLQGGPGTVAPDLKNPVAANEENLAAGAKLYINHCAGCHGIPSNPDSQFGRSFYPTVPPFFKDSPDMAENQNFYIIQHGIRWTGMPAWNKTLNETQIWQIVTFLSNIEKLPPAAKREFDQPGVTAPVGTPPGAAPMPMSH
jgi:mono/diheme cytochrome c family protein